MDIDLKALFQAYDSDKDGQLNVDQILNLLKELGHNIYKGSIGKVIRLLNYKDDTCKTLNYNQLEQYHNALKNKGKYNIWKSKYQILLKAQDIRKQTNAAPSQTIDKGQSGDLKITVGVPPPPQYPSGLQIIIQKQQKKQSKPFIKLTIECMTNEEAKKTSQLINEIYNYVIGIIKSQQPDFQKQIDTIKLITNVNNKTLLIFITTSNEDLIQLGIIFSKFIDQSINRSITALLHLKYDFDFNFEKFMTDKEYPFFNLLTKNCALNIKWKGSQFISALKQTLLMNDSFVGLVHDPTRPQILSTIAALSLQNFKIDIQFENTQYKDQYYQNRGEIMSFLGQIKNGISSSEKEEQIMQLLKLIKGKIILQACLGDWKGEIILNIKDLTKLITQYKDQQDNDA